jgi:AraC family carnitine catabolism transcriptional activator
MRAFRNYEEVGLFLAPQFPLYALVPLIEVFRIANQTAGKRLFNWHFITEDGGPVESGAGMSLHANASIYSDFPYDRVFVISGNDPLSFLSRRLVSWVQRLHAHGAALAGIDTGVFALAEAGLLKGRRAVCHWEAAPLFGERYPATKLVEQRYLFDPPIITCAGGIAALDMILDLVEQEYGPILARQIANGFVHAQRSGADGAQRVHNGGEEDGERDVVRTLIAVMEANIEEPLSVSGLAAAVGLPRRRLERLFLKRTQSSIAHYYMRVRLEQAREMLFYSHSSIGEIALMCGFGSPAVFARTFRAHFNQSPSAFRASHGPAEMARYRPQVTWSLSETRSVRR